MLLALEKSLLKSVRAYVWHQDDVDISCFYVRFVARREDHLEPNRPSIDDMLLSKHCAKIGGLALRADRSFEMVKTYSRVQLADAAADNGLGDGKQD
eukprot:COSAG02_NODE_1346_length_13140_cov_106.669964_2_plen_97_part_00